MPGNDARLIANLKAQNLLYTVAERGAESTELKIIGSMKEALHPEFDSHAGILAAMARPENRHRLLNRDRKRLLHRPRQRRA
ncbi:D-mannonate oxidoreductase [Salmonella enterica subsp. enterica]|uniref:D-mannonate oxidoreductase n=1 Tax=Salmonella enterica I TaxID=59201 RepID=A0A447TVF6_SALET|nr:D-mannonate oxidoreductase [Salmonella enterica subsp. enterica]